MYSRALSDIIRSNGEAILDYIAEMQDADELFASANTPGSVDMYSGVALVPFGARCKAR